MRLFLSILCLLSGLHSYEQRTFQTETDFQKFLFKQITISQTAAPIRFDTKISGKKCLADLRILQFVLEEAQTTLYRYSPKQAIDSAFSASFKQAKGGLSYLEMIREVAKIQHVIACGHSQWNHNPAYLHYRDEHVLLFPFDVRYDGKKWVLFHNNSRNQEISDNTEIIAINGIPIETILYTLKQFTTRDGTSTDRSLREPAKFFSNAYTNFIDQPETYRITIMNSDTGEDEEYNIEGLKNQEIDSIRTLKYPGWNKHGLPLKLTIIDSLNTAIYGIEWFRKEYIQAKGQDFKAFTDSVFAEIKKNSVENLVLDLRANTGGWTEYGKYLFSYFIDEPTPYLSKVVMKKYQNFSFDTLIVANDAYDSTFQMKQTTDGLYEWTNYPNTVAIPQAQNIFHGQVYILTDNFTRSCSGMFSSLMREHTNAIFIGEETGATQCGAGGLVIAIRLPHSGIVVRFSTGKYETVVHDIKNSRGVIPDVPYNGFLTGSYDLSYMITYLQQNKKR